MEESKISYGLIAAIVIVLSIFGSYAYNAFVISNPGHDASEISVGETPLIVDGKINSALIAGGAGGGAGIPVFQLGAGNFGTLIATGINIGSTVSSPLKDLYTPSSKVKIIFDVSKCSYVNYCGTSEHWKVGFKMGQTEIGYFEWVGDGLAPILDNKNASTESVVYSDIKNVKNWHGENMDGYRVTMIANGVPVGITNVSLRVSNSGSFGAMGLSVSNVSIYTA